MPASAVQHLSSAPPRFATLFGTLLPPGVLLALLTASPVAVNAQSSAAGNELFEKSIRPVLVAHCYQCHSALSPELRGGLRLDSRQALLTGGDSGPAVVPGNPQESLLIAALKHDGLQMPPDRRLPNDVLDNFTRWIELGAPDPRGEPANESQRTARTRQEQFTELQQWWSLQPVQRPELPRVRRSNWSQQPIDLFILAQLEQQALEPAPRAELETRVRRLSFALTGLPPSTATLAPLLQDAHAVAWPQLVDRLLQSPHFGERWARHWMDVVRYTDTYGYEWDMPAKGAWRYRDYLIRALNSDVPVDQLIREQIAGDLLPEPRLNSEQHINESLAGLMFFQMGEKRHGDSADFEGIHQEMLDNKIDAFSKAFQAQTIACARCHDHKLDPILQSEYYALGGILMSSRWVTNTLDTPERHAALLAQLQDIKDRLRQQLAEQWRQDLAALPQRLAGISAADSSTAPAAATAVWQEPLAAAAPHLPLEDPRHIWQQLIRAAVPQDWPVIWTQLQQTYAAQQQARSASNAASYVTLADFREGIPDGWSVDGVGLRQPVRRGDVSVALHGDTLIDAVLLGGLDTHAFSPRLNGAIRTPYVNRLDRQLISFEYAGGDFSAHRTIVDNAFLTERQGYLNAAQPAWLQLSTLRQLPDRRVYIELATKTSNPNFPPRVGLGGACSNEQIDDPRSWLAVSRVVLHDTPGPPADELQRFASLLQGSAPADAAALAARYADWLGQVVQRWAEQQATDDDVRLLNWLLQHSLLSNHSAAAGLSAPSALVTQSSALVTQYRELEAQLATPQTVNGMADIEPGIQLRLNVRGEYDQLADPVPRGYLSALGCSASIFTSTNPAAATPAVTTPDARSAAVDHSGRLQLAQLIASPQNPLTARVFVNRVWHWLFGTGLVSTPDDFGHLGDRPSHPELLDYLADEFVQQGWSLKTLIRQIVLSETWQQSALAQDRFSAVDPANRLLHHFPLRRLEAEAIRDAMLAVSGRLDPQLYGPTISPHRSNEDPQKRLFSGPVDGNGRRSIYIRQTIMEPPRFLALFSQPAPKIPTGRRDVANTPAQSLALLNDPFVAGQAAAWAQQLTSLPHSTPRARLQQMFQTALGRTPQPAELDRWQQAVADFAELHGTATDDTLTQAAVWTDVAHAMFNTKEFIWIP